MTFWWCLTHDRVEEGAVCRSGDRLGPYETAEVAASAPERVRERTVAEDERDKAEEDW